MWLIFIKINEFSLIFIKITVALPRRLGWSEFYKDHTEFYKIHRIFIKITGFLYREWMKRSLWTKVAWSKHVSRKCEMLFLMPMGGNCIQTNLVVHA